MNSDSIITGHTAIVYVSPIPDVNVPISDTNEVATITRLLEVLCEYNGLIFRCVQSEHDAETVARSGLTVMQARMRPSSQGRQVINIAGFDFQFSNSNEFFVLVDHALKM